MHGQEVKYSFIVDSQVSIQKVVITGVKVFSIEDIMPGFVA
jgi:hypothetical protein